MFEIILYHIPFTIKPFIGEFDGATLFDHILGFCSGSLPQV